MSQNVTAIQMFEWLSKILQDAKNDHDIQMPQAIAKTLIDLVELAEMVEENYYEGHGDEQSCAQTAKRLLLKLK